jgi:hypothetical protein
VLWWPCLGFSACLTACVFLVFPSFFLCDLRVCSWAPGLRLPAFCLVPALTFFGRLMCVMILVVVGVVWRCVVQCVCGVVWCGVEFWGFSPFSHPCVVCTPCWGFVVCLTVCAWLSLCLTAGPACPARVLTLGCFFGGGGGVGCGLGVGWGGMGSCFLCCF